jgi:hypothetical protein
MDRDVAITTSDSEMGGPMYVVIADITVGYSGMKPQQTPRRLSELLAIVLRPQHPCVIVMYVWWT